VSEASLHALCSSTPVAKASAAHAEGMGSALATGSPPVSAIYCPDNPQSTTDVRISQARAWAGMRRASYTAHTANPSNPATTVVATRIVRRL
jgi:hypothetical protein